MKLRTSLLAAVAALAMTGAASAAPITGSFALNGTDTVSGGVTVDTATSISFNTITQYTPGVGSGVLGNLAACVGNCGTGGTLALTSMTSPFTFTQTTPLFSLTNGLSFSLVTITGETRTSAANNNGLPDLRITGNILLNLAGFDATPGTFTIDTNGVTTSVTFAASGRATPAAVPEPASLALVGGGLAALGLVRRRRAK